MPSLPAHDRVAAAERGVRRERAQPSGGVLERGSTALEEEPGCSGEPAVLGVQPLAGAGEPPSALAGERRRAADRDARGARARPARRAGRPRSESRRGRPLRGRRAACPARGRRRSRPAPAGRDRADDALVAEREEILEAAAASCEDDHVDLGLGGQPRQGRGDRGGGLRPLNVSLGHHDVRRRKARETAVTKSRFAAASLPVRSPIRRGKRGSGRFLAGANSPSAASVRLQPLEPRQDVSEPDRLDRERPELELTASLVELGPPEDVDARAVREVEPKAVEAAARHGDGRHEPSSGSLSVKKTLCQPACRRSSVTSPSTQTLGSRRSH